MDTLERSVELLKAFDANDIDGMRALLAPDLVAWVTTSDGGAARVQGREAYLERIEAMHLAEARYSVTLTQKPVSVDEALVLLMVEIRAVRGDRRLHNFAAHLLRFDQDLVSEWRMADAKPAESDRFWA